MAARFELPEIDVLRGLAGACMVIHHVFAELHASLGPVGQVVAFFGSCAPVLFFFVTGLGYGIGRDRAGAPSAADLQKLLLLVLADQFLYWRRGEPGGVDFLGFIAFASLVLEGVVRTRAPLHWATALALAVIALRFGFGSGPGLRALGASDVAPVRMLLGASPIDGIGYPICPWLAYALGGFALGRGLRGAGARRKAALFAATLALAAPIGLVGVGLAWRGAAAFRWGTVSSAFFALSFGALGLALALAVALQAQFPALARALSLRGVSSLALVPVHYACIALVQTLGVNAVGDLGFALAAVAIALAAFAGSKEAARALEGPRRLPPALLAGAVGLAAALLLGGFARSPWAAAGAMALGQLALCGLFVLRRPAGEVTGVPRG